MSLGFLTESALVPSKAKTINVDAKSLVDLKAVVFQKDQERKRRLQEALTAENDDESSGAQRLHKYAHLRGGSTRRKRSDEDRVGKKRRNSGVEARSRRDEEAKQREAPDQDDDEAWTRRSAEMLRKKAKLYEEMARGGGDRRLKAEVLVNFDAKRYSEDKSGVEGTMVEITDEFGRSRKVATDSEEYAEFLQSQHEGSREEEKEIREERHVGGKDGGGFVVSQWEKRLKPTEKNHLKEIHERVTLAQSLGHPSSSAVDRKTRKQQRLERIRKQREEAAALGGSSLKTADSAPAVDSAASEKATDFLNQFSLTY